jgi:uncharacterized membrane protein (UPF0127 family)
MKKLALIFLLFILFLFAAAFFAGRHHKKSLNNSVFIDGREFEVELADTNEKRNKGLGGRVSLCDSCAMLFVFPQAGQYSFWMKDMQFALDFVWISGDKVVGTNKNIPPDYPRILEPASPVDKVLEINAGLCDKNDIKEGDKIIF